MIKLNTVAFQKHEIMLKLQEDNELMKNQIEYLKTKIELIQKQALCKNAQQENLSLQHKNLKQQQESLLARQTSLLETAPKLQQDHKVIKQKLRVNQSLKDSLISELTNMQLSIGEKEQRIALMKTEMEARDVKYEQMEGMVQVYSKKKEEWKAKITSIQAEISKIERQIDQISQM